MSEPIVIVGPDGGAYVPLTEHERMRAKKLIYEDALVDMARRMNRMAADLDKLNGRNPPPERREPPDWAKPTEPAPLGD